HRLGSPLLLLGSHRLRNPVYCGLAVSSFDRVEHPDDRHPDECCRAAPEVTVPIARGCMLVQIVKTLVARSTVARPRAVMPEVGADLNIGRGKRQNWRLSGTEVRRKVVRCVLRAEECAQFRYRFTRVVLGKEMATLDRPAAHVFGPVAPDTERTTRFNVPLVQRAALAP